MALTHLTGKFYDGKSATAHDVTIEPSGSHVRISITGGDILRNWSYNEIRILEDCTPPLPAKITSSRDPDARLLITAQDGWERLKKRLPDTAFPKILPTGFHHFLAYAALATLVIFAAIVYMPRLLEKFSFLIPESLERSFGEAIIASAAHEQVCVLPEGSKALQKIVRRLEEGIDSGNRRPIMFKVSVVDDPNMVNAVTAPGGYMILYSGALEEADDPGEVAGVLAHEMAHAALRHPARALARNLGFSLMTQGMLGGGMDTAKIISFLTQMHYSRADELAADDTGQRILWAANLDPQYMTAFFRRLENVEEKASGYKGEASIFNYLSTHPLTSERIERLKDKRAAGKINPLLSRTEWASLKNICSKKADFKPE